MTNLKERFRVLRLESDKLYPVPGKTELILDL